MIAEADFLITAALHTIEAGGHCHDVVGSSAIKVIDKLDNEFLTLLASLSLSVGNDASCVLGGGCDPVVAPFRRSGSRRNRPRVPGRPSRSVP